jgi:hypothetical protein
MEVSGQLQSTANLRPVNRLPAVLTEHKAGRAPYPVWASLLLPGFKSRTSTVGRHKNFICVTLIQRGIRLCQIFATVYG